MIRLFYGEAARERDATAEAFREASRTRRRAWRRAACEAREALAGPPALIWTFNLGLLTGQGRGPAWGGAALGNALRVASLARVLRDLGADPTSAGSSGEGAAGDDPVAAGPESAAS